MKKVSTIMTFAEACGFLAAADHILVDGKQFSIFERSVQTALVLRAMDPADHLDAWFLESDNRRIEVEDGVLRMREDYGEEALLEPVWSVVPDVSVFQTAETAAAFMEAIHSEVCRQKEGSDSAYEELYEVATHMGGGFTLIWSWVATMAVAARERMEGLWESGEAEFIECVHVAAQEFHNYITDPRTETDALTPEKAAELWESAYAQERESYEKSRSPRAAEA